jgi:hypothetical protein
VRRACETASFYGGGWGIDGKAVSRQDARRAKEEKTEWEDGFARAAMSSSHHAYALTAKHIEVVLPFLPSLARLASWRDTDFPANR